MITIVCCDVNKINKLGNLQNSRTFHIELSNLFIIQSVLLQKLIKNHSNSTCGLFFKKNEYLQYLKDIYPILKKYFINDLLFT